ncbi:MAG: hypothetical protein IKB42_05680 [Clostridia bacterium]|nr:hypothetical protein [Clostridia bacterium]
MVTKYTNVKLFSNNEVEFLDEVIVSGGEIISVNDNYTGVIDEKIIEPVYLLPKLNSLDISNLDKYNVFDLNNLTALSLSTQLKGFDKNKQTIMYLKDPILLNVEYDVIVPFCKKNNIKVVANVGRTLDEMGWCDKMYGMTPVDFLEECGVLDLEPIILSGANLEKSDIEKLAYYNATICLDVTIDWKNGNGIAQIATILKNNLNVIMNGKNIVKEMLNLRLLAQGYFKIQNIVSREDLINIATTNYEKVFNLDTMQNKNKWLNYAIYANVDDIEELING